MSTRHLLSNLLCAALFVIGLYPLAAAGDDAADYLRTRNQLHPLSGSVLPAAQQNPAVVSGRYIEMTARVGGVLTVDGSRTVLLTSGDVSLAVKVPGAIDTSAWMDSGESIRAVVYVPSAGNVTALADVRLIAAAPEYEVADLERRTAAEQSRTVTARQASFASRHGSYSRIDHDEVRLAESVQPPAFLSARARGIFGFYYAFVRNYNPRLTDSEAYLIAESIVYYSDVNDVDPRLVVAMIIAESDFNMYETSNTGAMGLGQLMPETARGLGVTNAFDPVQNIGAAVHILRGHLDTYGGAPANAGPIPFDQIALTMAAYNAGPGAVRKFHGVPPYRETRRYVARVAALYRALCGNG